jgi:branched-subunit amino acid aminotransferase/4-amino-4-deoxychorismate lyase
MTAASGFQTRIDGRAATAEDLAPLAFAGFAHFTAMQVRGGAVRGLDLHLARLRSASLRLFGRASPDDLVREYLREAIMAGPAEMSLVATQFSRAGEFTPIGAQNDPGILIRTGPASNGPPGPLRLATVRHRRPLAAIKHVGEFAKTYFLRKAAGEGYDDAAFVDPSGHVSEATIWNLAFWDGEAVVWPKAELLPGVTMGIIRRRLTIGKAPQREEAIAVDQVGAFKGAAVMNSWTPGVAVTGFASTPVPHDPAFIRMLHELYQAEPLTLI